MADLKEFLGKDLAHVDDFLVTPTGDIDIITGLSNVKNALFHRLVTEQGSIVHRPNYGVGIKQFQNSLSSFSRQQALAKIIQEQFEQDPRVIKVGGVSVITNDLKPELVTIIVRVQIQGYDETQLGFTPFGSI